MKNLTNTQGSVWLAVLVIIAVVVAALLLSGNYGNFTSDDQSVHGLVSEINQEEQYFLLTNIEVLSVAEDGSADIQETEYIVSWTGNVAIQGYHPSVLDGGEMVRVTPRERLKDGEVLIIDPELIDVTRIAEDDPAVDEDASDESETSTSTDS